MQAKELSIFEFLNNTNKIITNQNHREFCFDISDAVKFYNNIMNDNFIGIITLKALENKDEYELIDGYSRLLLFSLLICAISNTNLDYEEFVNQLKQETPKGLIIQFLNQDNDFYKAISTNFFDNLDVCSKNLSEIYNFFLQKITRNSKKTNNLVKKLFKTQGIFFILENEQISSQKIYASLNMSEKTLSEYECIKNFVYETCLKQKYIFNNYFLQMENEYKQQNIQNYLINFIKDYLTIQNNGKIPQKGKIFTTFKTFIKKIVKLRDIEFVMEDLYRYSKYYAQIITENISDLEIQSEIQIINFELAYDAYPYLMEVFDDWDNNNITKDMMVDILKMINLFIEQRKSPNASKFVMTFAKLSTQINKMLALKNYTPRITEEEPLTINKLVQ